MLQHTGAFKVRGAFHRMLRLSDAERAAGVVAASGGNHGLAVAYAARALGIQASVIMPSTAAATSVQRARADGANVIMMDTIGAVFQRAVEEIEAGKVMIHPFDDPAVVAGQGTLALELYEDAPEITDVIASIGGGGMIVGVATALKALNPAIRIWGVETDGADVMTQSLRRSGRSPWRSPRSPPPWVPRRCPHSPWPARVTWWRRSLSFPTRRRSAASRCWAPPRR